MFVAPNKNFVTTLRIRSHFVVNLPTNWRYRRYFLCVANDIRNTHVRSSLRADLGSIPSKHIMFWDRCVNASEIYGSIQFGISHVNGVLGSLWRAFQFRIDPVWNRSRLVETLELGGIVSQIGTDRKRG